MWLYMLHANKYIRTKELGKTVKQVVNLLKNSLCDDQDKVKI